MRRAGQRPARRSSRGHAQSRRDQPADELVAVDVHGAGGDEPGVRLVGHVVVIAIESAARDAVRRGERVQLVEVAVADQMRPQPAVRGPQRGSSMRIVTS